MEITKGTEGRRGGTRTKATGRTSFIARDRGFQKAFRWRVGDTLTRETCQPKVPGPAFHSRASLFGRETDRSGRGWNDIVTPRAAASTRVFRRVVAAISPETSVNFVQRFLLTITNAAGRRWGRATKLIKRLSVCLGAAARQRASTSRRDASRMRPPRKL